MNSPLASVLSGANDRFGTRPTLSNRPSGVRTHGRSFPREWAAAISLERRRLWKRTWRRLSAPRESDVGDLLALGLAVDVFPGPSRRVGQSTADRLSLSKGGRPTVTRSRKTAATRSIVQPARNELQRTER
jgi:hypothetical protein